MGKRLLVGIDDSEPAEAALSFAAEEWPDAELVLLTVIDPAKGSRGGGGGVPAGAEEWYEEAKATAEERLADAASAVDVEGDVETATTVGSPASALVEYAREHDVDHVVVGSHGRRGIQRVLLGSVAEAVVRNSTVPVTVVR